MAKNSVLPSNRRSASRWARPPAAAGAGNGCGTPSGLSGPPGPPCRAGATGTALAGALISRGGRCSLPGPHRLAAGGDLLLPAILDQLDHICRDRHVVELARQLRAVVIRPVEEGERSE